MMETDTTKFVIALADKFPVFKPLLAEHIEYFDEILPHLLIADYCRAVQTGPEESWKFDLLEHLEKHFQEEEDDPVSNLIAVSFVENMYVGERNRHWSVDALSPKMKRQYERIYGAV